MRISYNFCHHSDDTGGAPWSYLLPALVYAPSELSNIQFVSFKISFNDLNRSNSSAVSSSRTVLVSSLIIVLFPFCSRLSNVRLLSLLPLMRMLGNISGKAPECRRCEVAWEDIVIVIEIPIVNTNVINK